MILDFWVGKEPAEIDAMLAQDYDAKSTIYTTAKILLAHPGRLYLIPQAPAMDSQALSVYLPAFDGHQEIFLLGAHMETAWLTASTTDSIASVMRAYDTVQFVLVGVTSQMPTVLRSLPNVRCQTYREWISYCDV
jgi:hypothetical protein